MPTKKVRGIIIAAIIVVLLILLSVNVFAQVPTGHTGVVVTFGKVESYVLDEGIHLKLPWQKVVKMDNRAQKISINMQAFSSDIQQVDVVCAVNYSVDRATSQDLYRNVGEYYYNTVMEPRIHELVKAVFARFSADNLVINRDTLSGMIEELLAPEIKEYGIQLISVSIEDIDFTDVFTEAVEKKQVAEQSKLQAQIEQNQKIMEEEALAEREVIRAEAAASVLKIDADAKAYAVEIQAEAEAEANRKIAASLTEDIIAYVEANNWNGVLPQFYGADGILPILDLQTPAGEGND
ncbi:MAG: prohibitin family protein [Eubacteriales bacterium]|jgi:regulator of protease activity HflC (stomatin/prohibitin superfamily)|nr:prohibitin family protein [Eubacteriales bacterium]